MANGKLTDISIVDDAIVEIKSLITIMNEKNILVVSPLKTGKTKKHLRKRFLILKPPLFLKKFLKLLSKALPPKKQYAEKIRAS